MRKFMRKFSFHNQAKEISNTKSVEEWEKWRKQVFLKFAN